MVRPIWKRGLALLCLWMVLLAVSNAFAGRGGGNPGGGGHHGGSSDPYDRQFTSVHFSGSGNCSMCHDNLRDLFGEDVSIQKRWSSTVMANASRDPLWRAKVRSEINRNPQLESVIHSKCSKCHAPMAHAEAGYLGDSVAIFGNGFLNADNPHYNEAMDAVS